MGLTSFGHPFSLYNLESVEASARKDIRRICKAVLALNPLDVIRHCQ